MGKRFQTKEITFEPAIVTPGDTVTLTARIHNYSLVDTPQAVEVRFYSGDPDSGGTALVGTLGETELSGGILPARSSTTVEMAWSVPPDLDVAQQEIWAVVDPDNEVTNAGSANLARAESRAHVSLWTHSC